MPHSKRKFSEPIQRTINEVKRIVEDMPFEYKIIAQDMISLFLLRDTSKALNLISGYFARRFHEIFDKKEILYVGVIAAAGEIPLYHGFDRPDKKRQALIAATSIMALRACECKDCRLNPPDCPVFGLADQAILDLAQINPQIRDITIEMTLDNLIHSRMLMQ